VSRQLRYHQDAGSYQRKPVRKNPETTEQTALLMLFSFSLTMCRPLNRGFMIVAVLRFHPSKSPHGGLNENQLITEDETKFSIFVVF
jgi:hypothetical protein